MVWYIDIGYPDTQYLMTSTLAAWGWGVLTCVLLSLPRLGLPSPSPHLSLLTSPSLVPVKDINFNLIACYSRRNNLPLYTL
jgi:hypothetical protein